VDPQAVHDRAIVFDGTCPQIERPEDWRRYAEGGATVIAPTLAVEDTSAATLALIGRWYEWFRVYSDELLHVRRSEDVRRAKEEGLLGVMFAFQGSGPFYGELRLVEPFRRLGVRLTQIVYNKRNPFGDGSFESSDAGLSKLGHKLVREMNRVGMIVDATHAGDRTAREAIELSELPPVISHANARALCENRRNVPDELITAVAARSGLVGVVAFPAFVSAGGTPTIADLVAHIDYIAELAGIDHVAIGLDFYDGGTPEEYEELLRIEEWDARDIPPCPHIYPAGFEDATKLPALTAALIDRGYSEDDVAKLLGLNWLRVLDATDTCSDA
jgi:membrane dipeptidase